MIVIDPDNLLSGWRIGAGPMPVKSKLLDGVEAEYKEASELVLEYDVGKMLATAFRHTHT
jgi:hypothetical protein